jgi:hypothetical protein
MGTTLFLFGHWLQNPHAATSISLLAAFYLFHTAAPGATSFDAATPTDSLLLFDADIATLTPDTSLMEKTVDYIVGSAITKGVFLPTKAFLSAFDTNRLDVFGGEIARYHSLASHDNVHDIRSVVSIVNIPCRQYGGVAHWVCIEVHYGAT